jgi:hypothetical protein
MDDKPADNSMILRKGWPVVIWLSRRLGEAERDAVLGDLTECRESVGRAIVNVLGLVVRRQAAVLFDLRLWVAIALLILPVSYLLSAIARTAAGEGAVYSWMYLNNWDWALTRNRGFWYVLRETTIHFGIACLALACCSWSAGVLIGRLPNAILRASRNAFIVLLAASQLGDAPTRIIQFWMFLHSLPLRLSLPDTNAPVTANVFYRVFFPWIFLAILVILPALSGIRQETRSVLLSRNMRVVLVTAATISLLILLIQAPGSGLLLGAGIREWLWRNRTAMQVLPLLSCWPIFYLIAMGFGRYRRRKAAMAR